MSNFIKVLFCGVFVSSLCFGISLTTPQSKSQQAKSAQNQRIKELYQQAFKYSFDENWIKADAASREASLLKNGQITWKIDGYTLIH